MMSSLSRTPNSTRPKSILLPSSSDVLLAAQLNHEAIRILSSGKMDTAQDPPRKRFLLENDTETRQPMQASSALANAGSFG
jgi:hypothetical protein